MTANFAVFKYTHQNPNDTFRKEVEHEKIIIDRHRRFVRCCRRCHYIEHQIYSDKNFEQNRTKAIRMLEQRGYRVHDIDADDYRGRPVLDVEAYKGGREYDIKLSYPELRIIKERIDY